jgi:hypothetical protein
LQKQIQENKKENPNTLDEGDDANMTQAELAYQKEMLSMLEKMAFQKEERRPNAIMFDGVEEMVMEHLSPLAYEVVCKTRLAFPEPYEGYSPMTFRNFTEWTKLPNGTWYQGQTN